MFIYFKKLIDKFDPAQISNWVSLACSITLIAICLYLTAIAPFTKKSNSEITIAAYGFLSAHAFFTFNSAEKKSVSEDKETKQS